MKRKGVLLKKSVVNTSHVGREPKAVFGERGELGGEAVD